MTVSMPGTILSSLIYRLKSTPGDTVGLFLGDNFEHSVSKITDSEFEGTKVEKKTCIQQYVTVEGRHSFADNRGDVDYEKLESLLNNFETTTKSIVGWFVYRCNSSPRPSLMERLIHDNLMTTLPHSPGKEFVFGLFSEHSSGLLSIEYSFYQFIRRCLENIHVDIINLQSTSVAPYQRLPSVPIPSTISSHSVIMKHAREQLFVESGELQHTVATERLCRTLVQSLESLRDELATSYQTILDLDQEINLLQTDLDNRTLQDLNTPKEEEEPTTASIGTQLPLSPDSNIHELIQLGDKLANLQTTSNGLLQEAAGAVDLLTGSPPPTGQIPLNPLTTNLENESPLLDLSEDTVIV